ncbi:hypothetical protein AB595_20500 [Massilia sp. WF1]|uniref:DUF2868 domain-containing protein n=1 Tax=unclassified Massilia TaxID=2609279 RepID=UPI0006493483|nr:MULTISPECIES: DUF2868 domain-containing protein [unclassified Massilia]ALK95666.1 hypothetical protein AM586_04625 [Massilia sp. WG5]KLU35042.1 hypothetical protein AB595_20500 [Massilia sp. WF1]
MKEQVARKVTLVRAIETADIKHEILSDDDRMYASRSARELAQWSAADSKSPLTLDHFLEQRSEQILKRLAERTPAFRAFLQRRPLLPVLSVLLPLLALILGGAIDHIADPHRVDLLSAPLLLIIGWNLLVYVILLAWLLVPSRRTGWVSAETMRRLSVGKARLPRKLPAPLAAALGEYAADWTQLSWKLNHARLSRTIHLSAAAFALGAVISLYARGLLTEYAAGWESTFLDAKQVHTLLSWLFAPAMFLFPLDGFSVADVQALRFVQEPSAAGGARWVHLYAATLLLLVILPRLVLSLFAGWRAARLARRFPLDLQQPYYLKLADHIGAGPGPVTLRVLPYSFTLDERRDRGLSEIAASMFGEQTRVMLRPALPYGEDPKFVLQDLRPETGETRTVTAVLFNLAATPEQENHGALLSAIARQLPGGVTVLADESSLTERAMQQEGADARLAERIALWRQFCTYHQLPVTVVNLLQPAKYLSGTDGGVAAAGAR